MRDSVVCWFTLFMTSTLSLPLFIQATELMADEELVADMIESPTAKFVATID